MTQILLRRVSDGYVRVDSDGYTLIKLIIVHNKEQQQMQDDVFKKFDVSSF